MSREPLRYRILFKPLKKKVQNWTKFYLHNRIKYGLHCTNFHEVRQLLSNMTCKVSVLNFTNNVQEKWKLRYNGRYSAVLHENRA